MIHAIDTPLVFCDVETTGGYAKKHRVTEVACIRYEYGKEVARIDTLINPRQHIPFNIQLITGINNTMVQSAPEFSDVALEIDEIFANATLVAHHARFDFSFLQAEMERTGHYFNPPQICTAKLSRRLYATYRGHGLSKIIDRFGFTCKARHRAMGDTDVLVQFAEQMETDFDRDTILAAISHSKGAYTPPPNLDKRMIDALPNQPGVYSFYGQDGELLYVGKSVDIKARVMSHFSNANRDTKAKRLWSEVYEVAYETTASDFSAQLLEIHKIKNEMPVYNRRLRKNANLWALYELRDTSDYQRFELKPLHRTTDSYKDVFAVFRTKSQAKKSLESLVREHKLCPKFTGLESGTGECFSHQLGYCSGACVGKIDPLKYNLRIAEVFERYRMRRWPYRGPQEIIKTSPDGNRHERFVVNDWILKEAEVLEDQVSYQFFAMDAHTFDYDIYKVLLRELRQ